jgi:hypothetical protein
MFRDVSTIIDFPCSVTDLLQLLIRITPSMSTFCPLDGYQDVRLYVLNDLYDDQLLIWYRMCLMRNTVRSEPTYHTR